MNQTDRIPAVVFPFTWMEEKLAAALQPYFSPLIIYLPPGVYPGPDLADQVASGDVVLKDGELPPVTAKEVQRQITQMKSAAAAFGGSDYLKQLKSAPAFEEEDDDERVTRLQLKLKGTDVDLTDPRADKEVQTAQARALFLNLAHDHDQQLQSIQGLVSNLTGLEHRLEDMLIEGAEFGITTPEPWGGDLAGAVMRAETSPFLIEERLDAWQSMVPDQGLDGVFLTWSRAAWDVLLDRYSERLGDAGSNPVVGSGLALSPELIALAKRMAAEAGSTSQDMLQHLKIECDSLPPAGQDDRMGLTLAVFPEFTPTSLMARDKAVRQSPYKPGVVMLVED
ncbi:MAG: hypothetical protein HQK59_07190 [Deltaproteobacteria bacterium]|nr:hypothetical protein [Deltaproteobacteria bacterium]